MDFMNLLSESNSKKLIELASELSELSEKEDELISQSKELIEKGNIAEQNKNELNSRGRNIVDFESGKAKANLNNYSDSEEFISLITRTSDYKLEEAEIEDEATLIYKQLEDLNKKRDSIKNKINDLLSTAIKQDVGIKVKNIGIVHIVDAEITDDKEKIANDLCEIINCTKPFINEISNIYRNNITSILVENNDDYFSKLKAYTSNYISNKEKKFNDELEMLSKNIIEKNSEEETKVDEEVKEEPVIEKKEIIEEPIVEQKPTLEVDVPITEDKPVIDQSINIDLPKEEPIYNPDDQIVDNSFNEPKEKEEEPIAVIKDPVTLEVISEIKPDGTTIKPEEKKEDNIVSLSDIMGETKEEKPLETFVKEDKDNTKVLYIIAGDKVTPNQIARATKDKLYNKIALVFEGSYPKTKVETVTSLNQVNVGNNFNMESFIKNAA